MVETAKSGGMGMLEMAEILYILQFMDGVVWHQPKCIEDLGFMFHTDHPQREIAHIYGSLNRPHIYGSLNRPHMGY